ncbi:Hypothetical predicted protein [Cloeon dipterum]|uniref:Uncharacterized protein n=1 Tax=Cloeon dipterum TaxID=197152 RepID=A0A8S1C8R1_9INSE|nr:Hypothetical predicted protein [Cloeon dipterum]
MYSAKFSCNESGARSRRQARGSIDMEEEEEEERRSLWMLRMNVWWDGSEKLTCERKEGTIHPRVHPFHFHAVPDTHSCNHPRNIQVRVWRSIEETLRINEVASIRHRGRAAFFKRLCPKKAAELQPG